VKKEQLSYFLKKDSFLTKPIFGYSNLLEDMISTLKLIDKKKPKPFKFGLDRFACWVVEKMSLQANGNSSFHGNFYYKVHGRLVT
jgi:hypothetical protein